jgi:hypothetical protein
MSRKKASCQTVKGALFYREIIIYNTHKRKKRCQNSKMPMNISASNKLPLRLIQIAAIPITTSR